MADSNFETLGSLVAGVGELIDVVCDSHYTGGGQTTCAPDTGLYPEVNCTLNDNECMIYDNICGNDTTSMCIDLISGYICLPYITALHGGHNLSMYGGDIINMTLQFPPGSNFTGFDDPVDNHYFLSFHHGVLDWSLQPESGKPYNNRNNPNNPDKPGNR